MNATIFVPNGKLFTPVRSTRLQLTVAEYIGEMMDLCSRYRGVQHEYKVVEGSDRAILKYTLPLAGQYNLSILMGQHIDWVAEIVTDFFSDLKSASSGFASFDYDEAGYQASDLVKVGHNYP